MGSKLKLEFEYNPDRPEGVSLVIDWWRTVWADRMGSDIELAKEQLHFPHFYLQTINLDGGLYSKLGWESVMVFTHRDEQALLMLRIL